MCGVTVEIGITERRVAVAHSRANRQTQSQWFSALSSPVPVFVLADATPSVSVEWDDDDKESSADVELLVYDEVGLGLLFDAHQTPSVHGWLASV